MKVAIDVAPVADGQHKHRGMVVTDLINNAQVADADPIHAYMLDELPRACWTRVIGKTVEVRAELLPSGGIELAYLACRRWRQADCIERHATDSEPDLLAQLPPGQAALFLRLLQRRLRCQQVQLVLDQLENLQILYRNNGHAALAMPLDDYPL